MGGTENWVAQHFPTDSSNAQVHPEPLHLADMDGLCVCLMDDDASSLGTDAGRRVKRVSQLQEEA